MRDDVEGRDRPGDQPAPNLEQFRVEFVYDPNPISGDSGAAQMAVVVRLRLSIRGEARHDSLRNDAST